MTVDAIVHAIEADEADIGIAHNPPVSTVSKSWARRSLPIQFVARPEHPLLQRAHPLTVHEVAAAPLALLAPGFGLRKAVEVVEFLGRLQFTPVLETNSVAALKAFALSGAGATLLPFTVVRHECRRRELSISRIDHDVFNNAEMHLLTRCDRLLPPAAVRMMSFLNGYVNALDRKHEGATGNALPRQDREPRLLQSASFSSHLHPIAASTYPNGEDGGHHDTVPPSP